jgi:hypothetical protein
VLATLPLAYQLAPWYDAGPVPVELRLKAPAKTSIKLHWDDQEQDGISFVHAPGANTPDSDLWLAELPPRPCYHLTVAFDSPLSDAVLQELVLVNVRQLDRPVLHLSGDELHQQLVGQGIAVRSTSDGLVLNSAAGGALSLTSTVGNSPRRAWITLARVWLMLAAAVILVMLLALTLIRDARGAIVAPRYQRGERLAGHGLGPLVIAFGLGLIFHLANTASVPAQYNPCDPLAYFHKAVWLAEKGTYETQTPFWEIDRLPGYPLFLAACLKLFGYQLNLIALAQALLFGTSLLALALSLRRWISPWLSGAAVLILLVDPVGLQHSRGIGTESLFSSLAALSLAAFFESLGTQGKRSTAWLIVHALATTAAVFVRPNGVVLLAAPVVGYCPALAGAFWKQAGLAAKLRAAAAVTLRYSLPAVLLFLALGVWSYRNYRQHGLFAPTSMVGVSLVEGQMQSGTFESRSLAEDSLHREYLVSKRKQGYAYCGWDLRGFMHDQLVSQEAGNRIAVMDQRLKAIAARSRELSPWQLRAGGLLRSGYWVFQLPTRLSYTRNTMWLLFPYAVNSADATDAWKEFCTRIAKAGVGKVLPLKDLDHQEPATRWAPAFLRYSSPWHRPFYWLFLFGGFASCLVVAWKKSLAVALPGLGYLANVALNTWLLNIQGRYILTLEFALVFQTMLGLQLFVPQVSALCQTVWRRLVTPKEAGAIQETRMAA